MGTGTPISATQISPANRPEGAQSWSSIVLSKLRGPGLSVTWLLIAAPFALCLWFVHQYGVDVPWGDNWICLRLLQASAEGQLRWYEVLFYQVNQHNVGAAYACMLALAKLTHYDVRSEMFASALLLLLGAFLILKMARERLAARFSTYLALVPLSLVCCTFRHYENLLSGQLELLMSSSAFVLTIYLLDRVEGLDFRLPLAMVAAAISTFSFGNGALALPLGLLLLSSNCFLFKKVKARRWIVLSIWCVFSLLVVLTYFSCYVMQPAGKPDPSASPLNAIVYMFAYLGGPLSMSYRPEVAATMGIAVALVVLTLLVSLLRARVTLPQSMAAPAMLVAYALASDLMTSLGRYMQGVIQATSSRYVAFSYVGIAGLFILTLLSTGLPRRLQSSMVAVMAFLILSGSAMAYIDGLEQGNTYRERDIKLTGLIQTFRLQDLTPLEPVWVRPYNWEARNILIPFAQRNRLSVFRQQDATVPWQLKWPPIVHLDGIISYARESAGELYIYHVDNQKQKYLNVSGWCVDQTSRQPVGGASLCFDNSIEIPVAYGLDRPDVAALLKRGSYRRSGFTSTFLTDSLAPGQHTVALKVLSPDRKKYFLTAPLALLNIYDAGGSYFEHAGNLIYSLSAAGRRASDFAVLNSDISADQASKLSTAGGALQICAEGDHPQLFLPELTTGKARGLILKLSLSCPADTRVQVAYQTAAKPHYTWEQSIERKVVKGDNQVFVMLPGFTTGHLRIELGNCPGTYRVQSLEIKACR